MNFQTKIVNCQLPALILIASKQLEHPVIAFLGMENGLILFKFT